jgi:hypothetical protein
MMRSSTVLAIPAAVLTTTVALPVAAQDVLPGPDTPFKGHVGRTIKDSTKDSRPRSGAPRAASSLSLSPFISRRP